MPGARSFHNSIQLSSRASTAISVRISSWLSTQHDRSRGTEYRVYKIQDLLCTVTPATFCPRAVTRKRTNAASVQDFPVPGGPTRIETL